MEQAYRAQREMRELWDYLFTLRDLLSTWPRGLAKHAQLTWYVRC